MGIQAIVLQVQTQTIQILSAPSLVSGTSGVYTAEFGFSEDWSGWTKVAVFSNGTDFRESLLTEGVCTVPGDLLVSGKYLRIGVYGVQGDSFLPTVWTTPLGVLPGVFPAEPAEQPSLTLAEQILSLIGDLSTLKTVSKSNLTEAINEIYCFGSGGSGVSVVNAEVDDSGHLILYLSDGDTWDAGCCIKAAYDCAGGHNTAYRGECLGDALTEEQAAAIADGTFQGLYIGDYWTIDGVNYRIAAFDYFLNCGDTLCDTHHVVVVPDAALYAGVMNSTDTTAGGYVGSEMYAGGLEDAKTIVQAAFPGHVLSHRVYLNNAVTDGRPTGGAWYDSEVELMNEQMVYGGAIFMTLGSGTEYIGNFRVEKSQLPLFALNPASISIGETYWLRDAATTLQFTNTNYHGAAGMGNASDERGVRPSVCICG